MSASDELHRQLDTGYPHTLRPELHRALMARGIDYWVADGITFWNCPDGRECVAYGYLSNGKPRLAVKIVGITDPAQAIAVTLGSEDTYTREDVEGAFVSGYSLGLDMFDSSKPDNEKGWNQNERDMDEEMEELGWVRKDAAKLGSGMCHLKPWEMERDTGFYDSMECDCGYVADVADWASWHFCPSCGRQNVGVGE